MIRALLSMPAGLPDLRFLLGPWRWMILVYGYDAERDRAVVVTIQDARSSESATAAK